MRLLPEIFLLMLGIAALQGVLAIVAFGLAALLVAGLIFKPRETLPILLFLGLLNALDRWPLTTVALIVGLAAVLLIGSRMSARQRLDAARLVDGRVKRGRADGLRKNK